MTMPLYWTQRVTGDAAARAGLPATVNPFHPATVRHDEWARAYAAASRT